MSIIGGIIEAGASIYGAKKQNVENRRNATIAFERQRQLIKEANIYNAPKNQMQRLQEAGLNPHLIYGNGAGNMVSATAGTPPAAHAENVMKDINIYTTLKQMRIAERQVRVQERQASVAEQEANTKQYDSETKRIEASIKERAENRQDDETGFRILTMQEQIYNLQQEREFRNQLHEYDRVSRQLENDIKKFNRDQQEDLYPIIKLNRMLQNQDIMSQISLRKVEEALKMMQAKHENVKIWDTYNRAAINKYEAEFLHYIQDARKVIFNSQNKYHLNLGNTLWNDLVSFVGGSLEQLLPILKVFTK